MYTVLCRCAICLTASSGSENQMSLSGDLALNFAFPLGTAPPPGIAGHETRR